MSSFSASLSLLCSSAVLAAMRSISCQMYPAWGIWSTWCFADPTCPATTRETLPQRTRLDARQSQRTLLKMAIWMLLRCVAR